MLTFLRRPLLSRAKGRGVEAYIFQLRLTMSSALGGISWYMLSSAPDGQEVMSTELLALAQNEACPNQASSWRKAATSPHSGCC